VSGWGEVESEWVGRGKRGEGGEWVGRGEGVGWEGVGKEGRSIGGSRLGGGEE
jgi:hypothetical protein